VVRAVSTPYLAISATSQPVVYEHAMAFSFLLGKCAFSFLLGKCESTNNNAIQVSVKAIGRRSSIDCMASGSATIAVCALLPIVLSVSGRRLGKLKPISKAGSRTE
jgi:hypothetical protein